MRLVVALVLLAQPGPTGQPRAEGTVIVENAEDEAFQIGKLIRCPVCQGMPIAESPSEMAQNMMVKVREMVAAGKSREQIISYFENRYGEFARLQPKAEGINWLVWMMPGVAVAVGVLILLGRLRLGRTAEKTSEPEASADEDPYLRSIRDEVAE